MPRDWAAGPVGHDPCCHVRVSLALNAMTADDEGNLADAAAAAIEAALAELQASGGETATISRLEDLAFCVARVRQAQRLERVWESAAHRFRLAQLRNDWLAAPPACTPACHASGGRPAQGECLAL